MSNVLHGTKIFYFQIPQHIVKSGILRHLSASSLKLYVALWYKAQHHTKVTLTWTNAQIAELTGLAPNSVNACRTELQELGLLVSTKGCGGVYTYTLCNPETGDLLPSRGRATGGANESVSGLAVRTINKSANGGAGSKVAGSLSDVIRHSISYEEKRRYFELRLKAASFHRAGSGLKALCPFHADENASLSLNCDEGIWYCHACKIGGGMIEFEKKLSNVTGAIALENIARVINRPDLRVGRPSSAVGIYSYVYADGQTISQVLKYRDKTFAQRRPNPNGKGWLPDAEGVANVLYRLPEVMDALIVIVCEGEKDADNVRAALIEAGHWPEIAATTCRNGAGAWKDDLADVLKGKIVFVLPDNDEPGHKHAIQVAHSLYKRRTSVKIAYLPGLQEGEDVSDYLEKHTIDELLGQMKATPEWTPEEETHDSDSLVLRSMPVGNCDTDSQHEREVV